MTRAPEGAQFAVSTGLVIAYAGLAVVDVP